MDLREAITEAYSERFAHDKSYLNEKLEVIDSCENTEDLLYFCMNMDKKGFARVSEKLGFQGFEDFVWSYRSLSQGGGFIS